MSRENGVKLVNGLLKNSGILTRIKYDTETRGSISRIASELNKKGVEKGEYFITVRISYIDKE